VSFWRFGARELSFGLFPNEFRKEFEVTVNTVSEVQTTQKEPERERRIFTSRPTQVLWLLLIVFEAFLSLRFVLKLKGAKPTSPFAAVLYVFTGLMRLRMFQF
jgi:hypothetical protein